MKYNSVALLLGYNQVLFFFYPEVLEFLPIYFPHILSISGKPQIFSWESLYVHLKDRNQGGGKLMFMPFELVSICVWLRYFFQKHIILQLIHIYINSTC